MAAVLYTIEIYNKLRSLLEGHAPLAAQIRVGNWIDWTNSAAEVKRYALEGIKKPGDYPQIQLDIGDGETSLYTATQHYGMRNVNAAASSLTWTERQRFEFVLEITCEDKRITQRETIVAESLTAIRLGNPKLGLAYVAQVGPCLVLRTMEAEGESQSRLYRVARILIPVWTHHSGTDLIV